MKTRNPVFERHYQGYLRQLDAVDFSRLEPILKAGIPRNRKTAHIPFFRSHYQVSRQGVADPKGKRPDYGTCVILLKYILMCPNRVPPEDEWVNYRDFRNTGQSQNIFLIDHATRAISKHYTGRKNMLEAAIRAVGGKRPLLDYPYDISAVVTALPRVPILFLYNDADKQFPAQTFILFERRAEHFLDAECLVMVALSVLEQLKRAEGALIGQEEDLALQPRRVPEKDP